MRIPESGEECTEQTFHFKNSPLGREIKTGTVSCKCVCMCVYADQRTSI